MNDPWEDLAEWWLAETSSDPAYRTDVLPLLESVLGEVDGRLILDLGCGDGRVMEYMQRLGARPVGCDLNETLARRAGDHAPTLVGRLPSLSYLRSGVFDGVVAVLVLEHISDLGGTLLETARITRPGGWMAAVLNHPVYTAPGSAPIVDPDDGEVLWRWGSYLSPGSTNEPAQAASITFHHRPLAELLNEAVRAGWMLERAEERALSVPQSLVGQEHFPRLLGIRWRKEPELFK